MFKIEGYEILKEISPSTWQHFCFTKEIHLSAVGNIVNVNYLKNEIQGEEIVSLTAPFEPTNFRITGEGIETIEGLCEDGTIELTGLTGVTVFVETLQPNVENDRIEVAL